ncbi:MAG: acyltransferase [Propionibacteriaceae bacterium]|nr:acyltransferase [Propionibacteriaceae bacterium]
MDLHHDLSEMLAAMRTRIKEQYNRVVPTGELLFDRFSKAKELGAGEGSSVYDSALVLGDVSIGDHVWVGPNTVLDGFHAKLSIGNWVAIGAGVCIYTHDSSKHYLSGGKDGSVAAPVSIGNCTMIGTLAIINPGITIGDHCLVGAHCLVNQDVPDGSIVVGVPARVVGRVEISDDGTVDFVWVT